MWKTSCPDGLFINHLFPSLNVFKVLRTFVNLEHYITSVICGAEIIFELYWKFSLILGGLGFCNCVFF